MRWRESEDWSPDDLIAHQRVNSHAWALLQGHGVTEETELRLDFAYDAPDAETGERFAAFLRAETDYDVCVDEDSVTGSHAADDVEPGDSRRMG